MIVSKQAAIGILSITEKNAVVQFLWFLWLVTINLIIWDNHFPCCCWLSIIQHRITAVNGITLFILFIGLDGNFYIIVAGALISIPVAKWLMDLMYEPAFVPNIACGVDKSFTVGIYLGLFVFVLVLYFIINHMLVGRIKKMLPAEELKNRE